MGSANGRHRRPRQAPAIIVAAGVTGSAIAIPLLGAAGAHAADASTWDRVAECESGGMWSADLGNGYYGGLQFSQEVWKSYGGESYAERADLASRSQQIAVAEKVLEDQGPKAWPSCAVISGLVADSGLPGVDPGTTPSPEPSGSTDPSADTDPSAGTGASDDASGDAAGDAMNPSDSADDATDDATDGGGKADASASPSATPSTTPSDDASDPAKEKSGKHRGAPAPEETRQTGGGSDRDSGRHASRGSGDARDTGAPAADGTYTVRAGDNLWAIADAQKLSGGWAALYEANKAEVGSDPDLILPGQSLDLGVKAE
ncbi:transglycosylase family protein [Streptomyces sp. NBC_01463]|uniref:transglycosylase family protein n=1 Tax=unclassified Streptomyces TaxID=2593676 RepID=UPI002553AF41|nr:transglycosylase family protein [Streptomyces sp. RTGN2]WSU59279.1 transglycosylase family protein [Streptomyces sp. NBC_01104]